MTNRIDHEARALESDKLTKDQWATFAFETSDASNIYMAIDELKHATLALAEQQRIANLITMAESGRTTVNGALQALSALYDGAVEDGTARMFLRPNIAAALGFEV